jgi:hypothetical protein
MCQVCPSHPARRTSSSPRKADSIVPPSPIIARTVEGEGKGKGKPGAPRQGQDLELLCRAHTFRARSTQAAPSTQQAAPSSRQPAGSPQQPAPNTERCSEPRADRCPHQHGQLNVLRHGIPCGRLAPSIPHHTSSTNLLLRCSVPAACLHGTIRTQSHHVRAADVGAQKPCAGRVGSDGEGGVWVWLCVWVWAWVWGVGAGLVVGCRAWGSRGMGAKVRAVNSMRIEVGWSR